MRVRRGHGGAAAGGGDERYNCDLDTRESDAKRAEGIIHAVARYKRVRTTLHAHTQRSRSASPAGSRRSTIVYARGHTDITHQKQRRWRALVHLAPRHIHSHTHTHNMHATLSLSLSLLPLPRSLPRGPFLVPLSVSPTYSPRARLRARDPAVTPRPVHMLPPTSGRAAHPPRRAGAIAGPPSARAASTLADPCRSRSRPILRLRSAASCVRRAMRLAPPRRA